MTHEQYLDEPGEAIAWLTRIDKIERDAEQRRRAQQAQQTAGG